MGDFREATPREISEMVERRINDSVVPLSFRTDNLHETLPYAFTRIDNQDWSGVFQTLRDLCGEHRTRGRDAGNEGYWCCWAYNKFRYEWEVIVFLRDPVHAAAFKLRWC